MKSLKNNPGILIKAGEVCPFKNNCPFHSDYGTGKFCKGAVVGRQTDFACDLVTSSGVFSESGFRSQFDETGKMKIIME